MNTKINKKNLILLIVSIIIIGGCLYSWLDIDFSGIEKIKSYLSDFRFTAHLDESEIEEPQISSLPDQMSFEAETQGITEELTEEALLLEKTKDVLGQETTTLLEKKLILEEIVERVNEISKEVVLVSIQVQILSLEDISSQINKDEDMGEDTLEQISERVDQVSEKIESISAQLELLSS